MIRHFEDHEQALSIPAFETLRLLCPSLYDNSGNRKFKYIHAESIKGAMMSLKVAIWWVKVATLSVRVVRLTRKVAVETE